MRDGTSQVSHCGSHNLVSLAASCPPRGHSAVLNDGPSSEPPGIATVLSDSRLAQTAAVLAQGPSQSSASSVSRATGTAAKSQTVAPLAGDRDAWATLASFLVTEYGRGNFIVPWASKTQRSAAHNVVRRLLPGVTPEAVNT